MGKHPKKLKRQQLTENEKMLNIRIWAKRGPGFYI